MGSFIRKAAVGSAWRRRGAFVAVGAVVVAALAGAAFERVGAHAIVDAPNAERAVPPPGPGERRVAVGPPLATLSVAIDEPRAAPRATVFVLHGIRDRKEHMLGWSARLVAAGYRVVRVDSRGHGRSTGRWLSYGVIEACDLAQLVDALGVRPPIVAMGMSYGAATAIEWAGRDPRVEAAVAVAPFSSLREVVPVYVPRFVPAIGRLVPGWLVQRTVDRAGRLGGFDPDAASPLATIARARRVLIVHGRADDFVPLAQSESLAARAPDRVRLLALGGATHETIAGDPRWWPAVLGFLDAQSGATR